MQTQTPYFKYRTKDPANRHFGYIEFNGLVVHRSEDLHKFHKAMGYTTEIAKSGMLPDEFIWDKYFYGPDKNSSVCFQILIVKYLLANSASFKEKLKTQYQGWIQNMHSLHSQAKQFTVVC